MFFCYGKNGYCDYPKDCEKCQYLLPRKKSDGENREILTNYDNIRNSGIAGLINFIGLILSECDYCPAYKICKETKQLNCYSALEIWLNSEVTENEK